MKTFEELLQLEPEGVRAEFHADCVELFNTPAGQRILSRLCAARHPMGFPVGRTTDETLIANGQREVVATLYRFARRNHTT